MSDKKQPDQVSINIFDLIDSICAEFRRQWKAGKRPRIEDSLLKVPENAQEQLFRNLLTLEIRYRQRAGEKLTPTEYLDRFPELKKAVGDAFHYSTSVSMEALKGTPADDSAELTMTIEAPAANRIGDYELIRELGRGGFGVVYEAKHVTRRNRVALKTLPTGQNGQEINAERLHKFRREFRSLSEVNHPNLVGMQSLEVDGGQWFFTMDLVEGVDFLSYVRPSGKLDESRLRESLKQLAAGVIALHEQRILHRDLKPSNVLVDPNGRVSILDFGLVAELERRTDQTASMQTQHFAGTPRYAAPEQVFGQRSPATDWYAVGTMLFEALTGDAPYRGTAAELLIKKQNEDAPPLSDRDDLPSDLATLTDRLLRRAPEQRPGSEEMAGALAVELRTVSHSSHASHDDEDSSRQPLADDATQVLIGREEQLAQLEEAKQAFMRNRQPEVVWISGLSGEGKSSLAEKFLATLRRGGEFLVLSGRCYDRESVPFKAVDVLIEALVSFLRSRSQDQVNAWLPQDIQMLARLFPTLRRVESIDNQPHVELSNIDDRQIRYRAFYALRELLVSINLETPLVFFIDDLQWGDADSAEVLADLLAPPNPPALLLLGSYRTDEAEQSPFLLEWKRRSEIQEGHLSGRLVEVAPLTGEQCLEFMAQRVGIPAQKLREQVHDMLADTKGNPYFLEQLIEGFNAETGQFEPVPLRDIVERKLRQLPDDARDLLSAIAIAGQAVSVEEASLVAGHDAPLFSTVTHMRSERLVRLIGSGEQQFVDTYHDKIRETLLESLEKTDRCSWHVRFGEVLEEQQQINAADLLSKHARESDTKDTSGTDRIYDLAYHFHAADDSRSFIYQLLAGEQALRTYAIEEAITFYERAQKQLPENAANAVRYRLFLAIGRVMLWNNKPERSAKSYKLAELAATDSVAQARACVGIGNVYSQIGHFDRAIEKYDQAMALLGVPRTRTRTGTLFYAIKTLLQILLVASKHLRGKSDAERERSMIQNEFCIRLAVVMPEKNFLDTVGIQLRNSREGLRIGGPHHVAYGYAQIAFMLSGYGAPWIGNLLLRRSSRIQSDMNDPAVRGDFLYCEGLAKYWGGDLKGARASLEESLPLLSRAGSSYNKMVAAHMLRHTHAYTSSAGAEELVAREVLKLGRETGNVQSTCWGFYDVASALARRGEIPEAMSHMQRSLVTLTDERFNMTEAIRAATFGFVLLQASQYDAARAAALEGWKLVMKCPIDVTMFNLPILVECIPGPNWTSPASKSDVAVLKPLLRRAVLVHFSYPNHQPHLQRVIGRAFWSLGKQSKAIHKFEKAVKLARKKGMDYQRAKCLLDLATVKEDGRDENRAEAIALLKKMESAIPRGESWLLGDKYDEAVVAPEFDLEAWQREHGSLSNSVPDN